MRCILDIVHQTFPYFIIGTCIQQYSMLPGLPFTTLYVHTL